MKKLLSMLGAITLIGTVSTNMVACDGGKKPSPSPDTKIDISTKITSSIDLEQLSENTKQDFLNKLQNKLKTISGLTNITTSDYDVYKAWTTTAIQDSDITVSNSLNIKIVTKGSNFKGVVDNITVNYFKKDTRTDLSTIIQLTGLNLISGRGTTFSAFDNQILNANEFKNHRLTDKCYLNYYYSHDFDDKIDKDNVKQKSGIFFIIIQADSKDKYWKGKTPFIEIKVK